MQEMNASVSGSRRTIGNVLIALVCLLLLGSGAAKLAHVPGVVAQMASNGFAGIKITVVGLMEVGCAVLVLVRPTRSMGLLLVSGFLGGAIATHVGHDQPWFPPALVLAVLWVGFWLRHPETLWSLNKPAEQAAASRHQFEGEPAARRA
jgi:hypothetical protein